MLKNKFILILFFTGFVSILCAQEELKYDSGGRRNPFIPLVTASGRLQKLDTEESALGLSLEGIIYDKFGSSYAIVNSAIVKVGDKVGDYEVYKIEKNKIILLKEGQPLELELKKEGE